MHAIKLLLEFFTTRGKKFVRSRSNFIEARCHFAHLRLMKTYPHFYIFRQSFLEKENEPGRRIAVAFALIKKHFPLPLTSITRRIDVAVAVYKMLTYE